VHLIEAEHCDDTQPEQQLARATKHQNLYSKKLRAYIIS